MEGKHDLKRLFLHVVTFSELCKTDLQNPATSTNRPKNSLNAGFWPENYLVVSLSSVIMASSGNIKPHKLCRFVDGEYPHISFYAWHPTEAKLKRVRVYIPKELGKHDAIRWRKRMIMNIDTMLSGGMVIFSPPKGWPEWLRGKKVETNKVFERPKSLADVLLKASDVKSLEVRGRTGETYRNTVRRMLEWISHSNRFNMLPGEFGEPEMLEFSDWLLRQRKINGVTRNNYFQTLRSVFSHVVRMGHLKENPFANFRKVPQDKTARNTIFSPDQAAIMQAWMKVNDPGLYLFTRMIYWSFARPVELGRLLVRDAVIQSGVLLFPASVSKNRVAGSVRLPPEGRKAMADYLGDGKHDPDLFLFSSRNCPGTTQVGENTFSHRHRNALKASGVKDDGLTLYSWKHTGVCAAWDAGMDLFELKERCRHANVSMTETYLRDLGKWKQRDQEMSW